MSGYVVQLDPPAVATGRTMLDLNSGAIRLDQQGINWGDAAIQAYAADSRYGSVSVDKRVPNRIVTIPLGLGMDDSGTEETVRAQLQQKIARIQDEQCGWLLRQRAGGPAMYADIVDASLTLPDVWGEAGGVEDKVVLTLTCLPDFYGDEVALDSATGTGVLVSKLKASSADAVVTGDYPVRCRIVVSDTSAHDQHGLLWGVRSRHYDSAATAALVYEAEAMTPFNGGATATLSGASGGSVVQHTSLPAGQWVGFLVTNLASGAQPLTHQGSYRVWARCYSATATPQVSLVWGVGSLSVPITNDAVTLPGSGAFYLLDLGEIRLDAPSVGSMQWFGMIQAKVAVANDPIAIDKLYLQPVDEGAGALTYTPVSPASAIQSTQTAGTGADDAATGTVTWSNPGNVTAQDGTFAHAHTGFAAGGITHWLKGTNFGFAIPVGATIIGITASIVRYGTPTDGFVHDAAIRLIKAGTIQATDRSTGVLWPASPSASAFGSPTDMWGGTWTPTDVNNSGFGLALSATLTAADGTDAYVDSIALAVHYSFGGFTVAQDAIVYASQTAQLGTDSILRTDPAGGVYGPVSNVTGDLPRLPPSGLEVRPVELFVKVTRGNLATEPDSALDTFTATAHYRPCWLSRP